MQKSAARRVVGRKVADRNSGGYSTMHGATARERRAALGLARLEPGLGFWIAKQRWLWRQNRYALPLELLHFPHVTPEKFAVESVTGLMMGFTFFIADGSLYYRCKKCFKFFQVIIFIPSKELRMIMECGVLTWTPVGVQAAC